MKYLKEAAIIFAVTLLGELLNRILPLPVPAGVYGLFLLLSGLCFGIIRLEAIEGVGNFLLDIMPVLFVPASVGLLDSYGELKQILIPVMAVCLISTVVVMAVTGRVSQWMMRNSHEGKGGNSHDSVS